MPASRTSSSTSSARRDSRGSSAAAASPSTLREPLGALFAARTFLHVGFPLAPVTATEGDVEHAVVAALTSPLAAAVFTRFTRGPLRYRLSWAAGGRKRSLNFRVAAAVSAARPDLFNDPTQAPWEVVVSERSGKQGSRIFVELWPQGLADPRFAYRRHALFASSHPTIAAALARASGARPDDVVWDPFTGSAMELVERALLGPYASLHGTDTDASAIERARENLEAAGVSRFELKVADARTFRLPTAPTLVITNPPYGKRVRSGGDIGALLEATLANVASQLRPHGRLVWITPRPGAHRSRREKSPPHRLVASLRGRRRRARRAPGARARPGPPPEVSAPDSPRGLHIARIRGQPVDSASIYE